MEGSILEPTGIRGKRKSRGELFRSNKHSNAIRARNVRFEIRPSLESGPGERESGERRVETVRDI